MLSRQWFNRTLPPLQHKAHLLCNISFPVLPAAFTHAWAQHQGAEPVQWLTLFDLHLSEQSLGISSPRMGRKLHLTWKNTLCNKIRCLATSASKYRFSHRFNRSCCISLSDLTMQIASLPSPLIPAVVTQAGSTHTLLLPLASITALHWEVTSGTVPLLPALTLGTAASPELLQPTLLPPQLINKKSMREQSKSASPLTSRGARTAPAFRRPPPARGGCAPGDEREQRSPRGQGAAHSPQPRHPTPPHSPRRGRAPTASRRARSRGARKKRERRRARSRERRGRSSAGAAPLRAGSHSAALQPPCYTTTIPHRTSGPVAFIPRSAGGGGTHLPGSFASAVNKKAPRECAAVSTRSVDACTAQMAPREETRRLGAKRSAADTWPAEGWWHRAGWGATGSPGSYSAGADSCCRDASVGPRETPAYGARTRSGEFRPGVVETVALTGVLISLTHP